MTKDDGSKWTVTYKGKSGVKWEPAADEDESLLYDDDDWDSSGDTATVREPSPWESIFAEIASQAIITAIEMGEPHVRRWMRDKAVPFIKEGWGKLTTKTRSQAVIEQPMQETVNTVVAADPVDMHDEHQYRMTSAEAQQHQRDLEILAKLTALKMRMLTNAQIVDHPDMDSAAALEQQRDEERRLIHEVGRQIESSLQDVAPMIGSEPADQTDWVLRMLGYEVHELPIPSELDAKQRREKKRNAVPPVND